MAKLLVSLNAYMTGDPDKDRWYIGNVRLWGSPGWPICKNRPPRDTSRVVVVLNGDLERMRRGGMILAVEKGRQNGSFDDVLLVDNTGDTSDMAAHAEVLHREEEAGRLVDYQHFVFMNCSCRGPFVHRVRSPRWSWTDILLDPIRSGEAGLVAPLIEVPPNVPDEEEKGAWRNVSPGQQVPFAHTLCFAANKRAFDVFREKGLLLNRSQGYKGGVVEERRISEAVLGSGIPIASLLPNQQGVDWLDAKNEWIADKWRPSPKSTDPEAAGPSPFFGEKIHPFEGIFVKTGRNRDDSTISRCTRAVVTW